MNFSYLSLIRNRMNKIFTDKSLMWFNLYLFVLYILVVIENSVSDSSANNILTIIIPVFFIDSIKTIIESLTPKRLIKSVEDLSKVNVVIPCHNGGDFLGKTLKSLLKKFPAKSIIVSSNGSTDNTVEVAKSYGVRVLDIKEGVGKVEAINRALELVKVPYTLIMDDDVILGNAIVPTNILDEGYEAAAFRVLPIKENYLTELQTHEYRKSMDIGRMFHNSTGTVQNVSGAIGLFYTDELIRQTKIHSGEFSGEDLQRTLLIHLTEMKKGVVIVDSTVKTEVPSNIKVLFTQRVLGWNPGFYANFLNYLKLVFTMRDIPWRLRYEAFYNTFLLTLLDPIRVGGLVLLIRNPEYLAVTYVIYFICELVTWLIMGRKEAVWVVFIFPFYGMFNLITRTLALIVFFYRRLVVLINSSKYKDEYKNVNLAIKFASWQLTNIFSVAFVFASISATEFVNTRKFPEIEMENQKVVSSVSIYDQKILDRLVNKSFNIKSAKTSNMLGIFYYDLLK